MLLTVRLRRLVAEYLWRYLITSTFRPPDRDPTACQYGCWR